MTKFEDYKAALQLIGNTRMPYTIFVDNRLDTTKLDICENLMCAQQTLYVDGQDIGEVIEAIDKTALVLRIVGDAALLNTPMSLLFTEVITTEQAPKLFRLHKSTTVANIYLRQLIDSPDIVAFIAKSDAILCNKLFNVEVQPWHTVLVNKKTHEAVLTIWDTREIIAFVSNVPDVGMLLSMKHANDNSLMLYDLEHKLPYNSGFDKFTIYEL